MAPSLYGNCKNDRMLPFAQDIYLYLLENCHYVLILLEQKIFFSSPQLISQIYKYIISIVKVTSLDAVFKLHDCMKLASARLCTLSHK